MKGPQLVCMLAIFAMMQRMSAGQPTVAEPPPVGLDVCTRMEHRLDKLEQAIRQQQQKTKQLEGFFGNLI